MTASHIGRQQRDRFDAEIWYPARCSPYEAFLEIGDGSQSFAEYLAARKVTRSVRLAPGVDVWAALDDAETGQFDRVFLLDILDPLAPEDAARLLGAIRPRLNEGAALVVRVLNGGSPWVLHRRDADLPSRTTYTPQSLAQLADLAGYDLAALWPRRNGSARRRLTDAAFHRLLSWVLLDPPPLWNAQFYGMLTPR